MFHTAGHVLKQLNMIMMKAVIIFKVLHISPCTAHHYQIQNLTFNGIKKERTKVEVVT